MESAWTHFSLVLGFAATSLAGYFSYPHIETFARRLFEGYVSWLVTTREMMFRPLSRKIAITMVIASPLTCGMIGYLLTSGYGRVTVLFTALLVWVGYRLPRFIVQKLWHYRLKKFDSQLLDALNLMANSLKAGLNLPQVIQVLVKEMPNPLAQEFGLVLSQQKLGLTLEEALERMSQRIPTDDLSVAVHSVLILRETGGDLSETFETIANTIRERRKVEGKIKALTQQGRMQGFLLFLMPFAIALLLYIFNPDFILPLVTTRLGWTVIAVMLILQVIGGIWIRKIVTIEV